MRDEQEPRTDRPAEGVDLPLPGIKTAEEMENAAERLVNPEAVLESNELHAGGRTCARCGREIQPGEDVRRTLSGAYQHDFCPLG